ncbi:hypothetical protein CYLTODRAFT_432795 [Cylindrobasidium torrendii FP15055 ss-10]|uniref:Uncharacterized protein n=1 Tax=Cylindrobasidium torrendii FP15055 ss-10 TaxID=1314674 RepID=A0A0D7B156_9AGAR|nr:hypothetical protein CYLTODRAFT_432795 [Cylindrobasidium torrendii FP15055 ss-10]
MFKFASLLGIASLAFGQGISSDKLQKFEDVLALSDSFDPIQAAYWTGLPHHRRTPFAVSPDGTTAFLAYLNSKKSAVVVQQVDPSSFKAIGDAVNVSGYEAGGLVAHNDGFALLTKTDATGSSNLPTDNTPVATLVRYTNGAASWSTELNGASSFGAGQMGRTATPDINGDLVYSESAGLYGAYYVVTAYDGDASGHYGDAISYVSDKGERKDDTVGTNAWGCSHNTGIAFEEADEAPFASVCAEDHGSIWLNTDTRGMSGIKIAGENTTNGVSGEPMGGMSGSYSNLARLGTSGAYMFAWQSRGCVNLKQDDWMGAGFTQCDPRWLNHNVAVAPLSSKNALVGNEAISEVGAAEGDKQVIWITEDEDTDHQNVRVAAFDESNVLVTYEIISNPTCEPVPLSCSGTFSGTGFQLVSSSGATQGSALTDTDVTVSGDIAKMADGRLCWPYVKQAWDLSAPKDSGTATSKMSFACISLDGPTSASSSSSGNASSAV